MIKNEEWLITFVIIIIILEKIYVSKELIILWLTFKMYQYFSKEFVNDILIIDVNSSSATTQYADEFSKIIKAQIKENRKKL